MGRQSTRTSPVRTRRWTRGEYDRLIERGVFGPEERLELIDGELLVREPQGSPHAVAVGLVQDALAKAFGRGWHVRNQSPVALDDASEPEPDVAVVRGARRDYREHHPARPELIVEVAETGLRFDRRRKSGLYARAGVPEYWIVNLVDRVLEVYREPVRATAARHGWKYRQVRLLKPPAAVSPLAAPAARVRVSDLLP